jgi:hypothetical protein
MRCSPGASSGETCYLSRLSRSLKLADDGSCPLGGPIHCCVGVSVRVLHQDVPRRAQRHFDAAVLVVATARTIDVGKSNDDAIDPLAELRQRKLETPLHMGPERLGQLDVPSTHLHLHKSLLVFQTTRCI